MTGITEKLIVDVALKGFIDVDRVLAAVTSQSHKVFMRTLTPDTDYHNPYKTGDTVLGAIYQQRDIAQAIHQIYPSCFRRSDWG